MSAADRSAAVAEMGNLTRRRGGPTPLLSLARLSSERHDDQASRRRNGGLGLDSGFVGWAA